MFVSHVKEGRWRRLDLDVVLRSRALRNLLVNKIVRAETRTISRRRWISRAHKPDKRGSPASPSPPSSFARATFPRRYAQIHRKFVRWPQGIKLNVKERERETLHLSLVFFFPPQKQVVCFNSTELAASFFIIANYMNNQHCCFAPRIFTSIFTAGKFDEKIHSNFNGKYFHYSQRRGKICRISFTFSCLWDKPLVVRFRRRGLSYINIPSRMNLHRKSRYRKLHICTVFLSLTNPHVDFDRCGKCKNVGIRLTVT